MFINKFNIFTANFENKNNFPIKIAIVILKKETYSDSIVIALFRSQWPRSGFLINAKFKSLKIASFLALLTIKLITLTKI